MMTLFQKLPQSRIPIHSNAPQHVFQNDEFLVQIFQLDNEPTRLTINKVKQKNGKWVDGITWDELMCIKRMVGFQDHCAVEIYPPDEHIVNVANMRHLWIVEMPEFVWKKELDSQQLIKTQ